MPKTAKVEQVRLLTESLARSQSVVLAEFQGLRVGELTNLRRRLREQGGELKVVKNTLLRRALQAVGVTDLDEVLQGPTLAVFAYEDPAQPVKVVSEFGQDHKEQWRIKAGILGRRRLTPAQVEALARLPSREQLLAQLAGLWMAPVASLARVLAEPIAQVGRALAAVRDERQRQQEGAA